MLSWAHQFMTGWLSSSSPRLRRQTSCHRVRTLFTANGPYSRHWNHPGERLYSNAYDRDTASGLILPEGVRIENKRAVSDLLLLRAPRFWSWRITASPGPPLSLDHEAPGTQMAQAAAGLRSKAIAHPSCPSGQETSGQKESKILNVHLCILLAPLTMPCG